MESTESTTLFHDLKDQTNGISFCIEILKEELNKGEAEDTIKQMQVSCANIIEILSQMKNLNQKK